MPFFSRFSAYFEETVRQGSIRKAAERLNIAASAIDRQILNAEEMLGTPLFERLPNGLRLTASGELVIHCLRSWSEEHGKLRRQIEALKGARGGEVTIAAADGLAAEFIPTAITRIYRSLPGVKFRVIVSVAETVASLVRSGECDIGLTFDPMSFAGLSIECAMISQLGIVTPPDHPLVSAHGIRFSDCIAYPVVAPDRTTALWRLIDLVTSEKKAPLDIVFTSNNVALLCEMVAQGVGIGLMRDLDALVHMRGDKLAFTPLLDSGLPTPRLSLIVARGRRVSTATDLIIQHLKLLMHEMEAARTAA